MEIRLWIWPVNDEVTKVGCGFRLLGQEHGTVIFSQEVSGFRVWHTGKASFRESLEKIGLQIQRHGGGFVKEAFPKQKLRMIEESNSRSIIQPSGVKGKCFILGG